MIDETKLGVKPLFEGELSAAIACLGRSSLQLYNYLAAQAEKPFVQSDPKVYMTFANIRSNNTYRAAIKELIHFRLIAPTLLRQVYWIRK